MAQKSTPGQGALGLGDIIGNRTTVKFCPATQEWEFQLCHVDDLYRMP